MKKLEISRKKALEWLDPFFDTDTQNDVREIMKNEEALIDSFLNDLEFGTGGMRGIMGAGTGRINKYTLGKVTQGLADYLRKTYPEKSISVVIAHDVRHNSKEFSQVIANVLSDNNIKVYLFPDFCPTPLLSYAVRFLGCDAGIMLTASHNPLEYNGYKIYNADGAQVVPPEDKKIIESIERLSYTDTLFTPDYTLIEEVPADLKTSYIQQAIKSTTYIHNNSKDSLKIVFTPIHGTATHLIPESLSQAGFSQVHLVEEQAVPSGDFPTVSSPNPEDPPALQMAIDLAKNIEADILVGTDPDADRLGVGIRSGSGEYILLNGNQTNTILTYFILSQLGEKQQISPYHFIGSTIVSSEIFIPMARFFGLQIKTGLTGFKWIANMIKEAQPQEMFLCGGEESYGFMVGDFVRDKDAVSATLLFCEIAAWLKSQGKTAIDYLDEIYMQLGVYTQERLLSYKKEGVNGKAEIDTLMKHLRLHPPVELFHSPVVVVEDYKDQPKSTNAITNESKYINSPPADVLIFRTEKNDRIAVRPSGTEPKIKFYLATTQSAGLNEKDLTIAKNTADKALDSMSELVQQWMD